MSTRQKIYSMAYFVAILCLIFPIGKSYSGIGGSHGGSRPVISARELNRYMHDRSFFIRSPQFTFYNLESTVFYGAHKVCIENNTLRSITPFSSLVSNEKFLELDLADARRQKEIAPTKPLIVEIEVLKNTRRNEEHLYKIFNYEIPICEVMIGEENE